MKAQIYRDIMKARSLSISLPNYGCNKNCKYCVSEMTGYLKPDEHLIERNAPLVAGFAERSNVNSVLFTSKGEPLLPKSFDFMKTIAPHFEKFPKEIQTNGILLQTSIVDALYKMGFHVIAISIDGKEQLKSLLEIFNYIHAKGMMVRLTVNVSTLLEDLDFTEILASCQEHNVRQLTFRKLTIPAGREESPQAEWIQQHASPTLADKFTLDFYQCEKTLIRTTVDGINIYDAGGVAILFSDYCIQEQNNTEDVRSLIFKEDGHLYTSWNSQASILF